MDLSTILKPEAVKVVSTASSKKRLFQQLGEAAESCYGLKCTHAIEARQERETLGTTGVGHGIALPHARSHAVAKLGMALGIARTPIDFPSGDERRSIHLICLIAVPAQSPASYLALLGTLATTFDDPQFKSDLFGVASADELSELLSAPRVCC